MISKINQQFYLSVPLKYWNVPESIFKDFLYQYLGITIPRFANFGFNTAWVAVYFENENDLNLFKLIFDGPGDFSKSTCLLLKELDKFTQNQTIEYINQS